MAMLNNQMAYHQLVTGVISLTAAATNAPTAPLVEAELPGIPLLRDTLGTHSAACGSAGAATGGGQGAPQEVAMSVTELVIYGLYMVHFNI